MRPPTPSALTCCACLAMSPLTASALAQDTPIFTEDQKILASDGTGSDLFGLAVSIHRNRLIVGGPFLDGPAGNNSGAAYIFQYDGTSWTEEAKLFAPDGTPGGYFGGNVAVYGDVAVVRASHDNDPANQWGAVYVYRYDGQDWDYETKFVGDESGDEAFGQSLGAHENLIVIGDHDDDSLPYQSGAVTVYIYVDTEWVLDQKLYGRDEPGMGDKAWSVATDGARIIIGDNVDYANWSWVSIYRHNGDSWIREADLTLGDLTLGAWYGRAVDVEGDLAIVGCPDDGNGLRKGRAYIYRFSADEWAQEAMIQPSDLQPGDYFGEAVAIADEQTVVVQAFGHELDGYGHSALYVFRKNDGEWTETGRLTTSDTGDFFGLQAAPTLSADGTRVVVGAPFEDNQNGVDAGSAFYYDISCAGDLNGDLGVDQSDLGILLAAYGVDDGADLDGDGDTDQADLGALLAHYDDVCP
jgi:FG-GAP repeat